MKSLNIIIAERDSAVAQSLYYSLDRYFRSVRLARSLDELRSDIPRHRVDIVVADLETVALPEIARLRSEFALPVICTHRIPDEDIWTAALQAGAADVCANSDAAAIVAALQRSLNESSKSQAA
jgi:DNA-binding NtrC family response regulator